MKPPNLVKKKKSRTNGSHVNHKILTVGSNCFYKMKNIDYNG